ncbi:MULTISPECIES: 16S rRNA (uracil(1498)-N(3))-methyltransferase [unclassified Moraxella]|uniref:16S rRNA (uracil(1498)-N(3))-methyltransferase n=1 Tax=unclassified Moraxella TaxID=2685852 RepID=UPI003AF9BB36
MNILLLPPNPQTSTTPTTITLTDPTLIKHLHETLKLQIGDSIKVGITNGNLGTAIVQDLNQTSVTLCQIHCPTPFPAKLPLTVILALPRPKVLRRLIMDMTAMGVQKLILVNSYRTEKSYWQSPLLAKIDEYIHEGLQQGCDTVPMLVECKKRLKPFVEDELPAMIDGKQAIIAHPYANSHFSQVYQSEQETVLVIGAEGGWIDYEVALFEKMGVQSAHIGQRILRTENAVSVLCGMVLLKQN